MQHSACARQEALPKQGDQIGRILANWAIIYFGQVFENYRISTKFLATFSTVKIIEKI
jgi:hypothetical protein